MKGTWTIGFVAVLGASWARADLGIIERSATGHRYERVDAPLTWTEAKVAAEGRAFSGVPGHLVTITSGSEQRFIADHFVGAAYTYAWLGGFQPPGSPEPRGGWSWVTNEAWGYSAWDQGEPDDGGDGEGYLAMGMATSPHNVWNDLANDDAGIGGYVVEYEPPAGDANFDGTVDVVDLAIVANHYNAGGNMRWGDGDFDGDEDVDIFDLGILASNYAYATGADGEPIPAPATLVLLAVGSAALVRRRP